MRILHVLNCFTLAYGGPYKVCREMCMEMASRGHTVAVCTTNLDHPAGIVGEDVIDAERRGAFAIHRFPAQIGSIGFSLGVFCFLLRHMREFDVVHIHGLYRFPQTISAILARLLGRPYVVTVHGALDPYLVRRRKYALLQRLYERLLDFPNIRRAAMLHFTANAEKELTDEFEFGVPCSVIANGITASDYDGKPKRRDGQARGQRGRVLYVGRLHPSKAIDVLIRSLPRIHSSVPGATLTIVGQGESRYQESLEELVEECGLGDSVKFLGLLDHDDVIQEYKRADLLVLASHTENFGLTVVEAMASGTPVVVSKYVKIADELSNARVGAVVEPCPEDIASTVSMLLSNEDLLEKLAERGTRFVRQNYDWSVIGGQLEDMYQSVIRRAESPNSAQGH